VLDVVRYLVVLEGAFAVGLLAAVVSVYVSDWGRTYARPVVAFAASYGVLVAIAAWSEWIRIGSDHLGWYAPIKAVALAVGVLALAQLFRMRPISRGKGL
jgi:hypothetical protein